MSVPNPESGMVRDLMVATRLNCDLQVVRTNMVGEYLYPCQGFIVRA
jgi:hypothetical protein